MISKTFYALFEGVCIFDGQHCCRGVCCFVQHGCVAQAWIRFNSSEIDIRKKRSSGRALFAAEQMKCCRTVTAFVCSIDFIFILQIAPMKRVCVPAHMKLSMKNSKDIKVSPLKAFVKRISAVLVASVAISLAGPQRASAKTSQYGISSDGQFYNYAPQQTSSAPYGAAAGLTALTFGGMCAVAIKKEKIAVAQEQENIEKELDRLVQYKQEFLDGVPSDRSIYASLAKAMSKDAAPSKPAKQEDEFEKNVKAFLEEEEAKNQKKKSDTKKSDGKGPGSALLERPGDVDGSKADAWMNDIVIDDKPAEIADEDLKRLQRMFGGDLPKL